MHAVDSSQDTACFSGEVANVLVQIETGINAVSGPNTAHVRIAREDLDVSESVSKESVGCDETSYASTNDND